MLQAQAIAAQGVTDLDNYLQKGEKPAKQRVMFRGILITQDNADKVQDFNIKSLSSGGCAPAGAQRRALCLRKPV